MDLKATHNSGTGEQGNGILSYLVSPFSKCQSKSIIEQWLLGVRLFDFRVRKCKDKYVFAHGLWESKISVEKVLKKLNALVTEKTYIMVTYEGEYNDKQRFIQEINSWFKNTNNIILTEISIKKPKWKTLVRYYTIPYKRDFKILDFRSWHTLLPIPLLWKKLYYDKPKFNNIIFTMVDFL